MGSGVGMNHQTLHVSHVSQQREDLQGVDELPGLFLTALDLEGEDGGATVGEVLLIEFVVVMAREGRMVHLGHLGMVGEEIDHLQGILHMTLYAQAQRLDTLQEDKGIEGRDGSTSITQDDGTDAGDISGSTYSVGKYGVGNLSFCFQSNLPPSTMTPPRLEP